MMLYEWPGNVRELENAIERAVITTQDNTLRVELPKTPALTVNNPRTLEEIEREYIVQILKSKHWRIEGPKGAALVLGLNPATLRSRMRKLGIQKPKP